MTRPTALWWVRRDLRLADNPALTAAAAQGAVVPVFILDPETEALGAAALRYSVAGRIGAFVEPATLPMGFDWRTDIALIGGIAAKEAIVSTLGTAYSLGEQDPENAAPLAQRLESDKMWNKATALSLMLFVLLYSPCFVALVVIKQETGSWGWLCFSMVFNTLLASGVSLVVYQIGSRIWGV